MPACSLCIHGHFYQPPRMDPFTGHIPREADAAPYANWNERITAECYAPNAEAGNFEHISFNLGGTLARWLDRYAHATYERIVAAERGYREIHAVGNGLAQPVHHTILPLARRRDKICQVRWGIASFTHRFGHQPEGMWLPEMAVDHETLEIMAAEGVRFTILSDEQVRGDLKVEAGPYRVHLPDGGEIAVFIRDGHLSDAVSFGMPDPAHVDEWLQDQMEGRCRGRGAVIAPLLLIATDGETFGHHQRQGVAVLSHILGAEGKHGYGLTTLGLYLRQNPPQAELEVIENTAWSCPHRLDRWAVGCACTPGDSRWKGALRRALDNLACDLDQAYVYEAQRLGFDPWPLRDDYIAVVMGQVDGPDFLTGNGLGHLSSEEAQRLLWLLEAQFYRQRMYASCTFFFDDLERHEPRYAIANGVHALALTRYATGEDLSHGFRRDLGVAMSERTGRTAADIYDQILERAEV
jgi:hypothetical protein